MVVSEPAESHPDSGKLADLVDGTLEKQQAKDVIKHLLRGCPQCIREVAPAAELLLPGSPPRPAGDGTEYEPPIERAFNKVRLHWHALKLDLATLYLRQGRLEETRQLVEEMLATFRSLGIRREAIAALLVLHRALERQKATLDLMRLVTARIRRVAAGSLQPI